MAAQIVPQGISNCTLYELEDNLQALVNSIDLAEEPSSRAAILEEIGQALRKTREKRDRVVAFLRHCELQQEFADQEIARLQKRKAFIARVQQELELRVIQVVEEFAVADRKGIKRLEGNCSSMRIQKNPDSVVVGRSEPGAAGLQSGRRDPAGLCLGGAAPLPRSRGAQGVRALDRQARIQA